MELATGTLPPRPPAAPLPEHRADAWGDFLRRVLFLVNPVAEDGATAVEAPWMKPCPKPRSRRRPGSAASASRPSSGGASPGPHTVRRPGPAPFRKPAKKARSTSPHSTSRTPPTTSGA